MIFTETRLKGAFVIEADTHEDDRGIFLRSFCASEFKEHGLSTHYPQCNLSSSLYTGTLRGMHFQKSPYSEVKLVRCVSGNIYDVIIDLRQDSTTRNQWIAVELSAKNRHALYVPEGFAHGFQTREDNTDVYYHMGEFYHPESAAGIRWNDPAFNITWPIPKPILSDSDANYADFQLD